MKEVVYFKKYDLVPDYIGNPTLKEGVTITFGTDVEVIKTNKAYYVYPVSEMVQEDECIIKVEGVDKNNPYVGHITGYPTHIFIKPRLKEVHCRYCGKLLMEAKGEIKKRCPACKKYTHVLAI